MNATLLIYEKIEELNEFYDFMYILESTENTLKLKFYDSVKNKILIFAFEKTEEKLITKSIIEY